jgi:hypothetical protein
MANLLQHDATINDALPTIIEKEEFVRLILGNLMQCKRLHGNASVRIGVTGDGTAPYHRISYYNDAGIEVASGAFIGGSPFKNVTRVNDDTWSSTATTLAEVQAILGELRQFKPHYPVAETPRNTKTPHKRKM